MHIVYLCPEYPPSRHGGIGSFIQTLGRALVERGHQVSVLGLYDPSEAGESDDLGVRVIRVPKQGWPGTRYLQNGARLRAALRRSMLGNPWISWRAPTQLRHYRPLFSRPQSSPHARRAPLFSAELGGRVERWLGWQECLSFATATHLIAVSRYVGERTRQYLSLGERPVKVIYNPVNLERFSPLPEIPETPGRMIYIGTLIEKGIRQLLQALPAICEKVPEAHLEICGNDTADPETGGSFRARLENLIPESLRPRVRFHGAVARADLPAEDGRGQRLRLSFPHGGHAHCLDRRPGHGEGGTGFPHWPRRRGHRRRSRRLIVRSSPASLDRRGNDTPAYRSSSPPPPRRFRPPPCRPSPRTFYSRGPQLGSLYAVFTKSMIEPVPNKRFFEKSTR
jgi:glycosyltransferase involved in cell wall biosynthesis